MPPHRASPFLRFVENACHHISHTNQSAPHMYLTGQHTPPISFFLLSLIISNNNNSQSKNTNKNESNECRRSVGKGMFDLSHLSRKRPLHKKELDKTYHFLRESLIISLSPAAVALVLRDVHHQQDQHFMRIDVSLVAHLRTDAAAGCNDGKRRLYKRCWFATR
jgi:hypothetical protein